MNTTWQQAPSSQQNITAQLFRGTATEWYIPNLTAGQTMVVNFTLSGMDNITTAFIGGVRASTTNTTVVLG